MLTANFARLTTLGLLGLAVATGCGRTEAASTGPRARTMVLGAYTTPREVYGREILPAFARAWNAKTGDTLTFQESYLASGAQARAIVGGFEADVAALSLEPDLGAIAKAGLITHDWKGDSLGGVVSHSVVVLAVREGNPKGIRDWDDLARPGVEVLTPNPRTSGGAMWNIVALYGAAIRGGTSHPAGDSAAALQLLRSVLANVKIMDKGGRESILTFEKGVGDVAITYENEVVVARQSGQKIDYVIPRATVLIENPVAVVDVYADKHHTRDLADAFVRFLASPDARRSYAKYGLRPVDVGVAKEMAASFPTVASLFTIRDLGGWADVTRVLFAPGGVYDQATSVASAR